MTVCIAQQASMSNDGEKTGDEDTKLTVAHMMDEEKASLIPTDDTSPPTTAVSEAVEAGNTAGIWASTAGDGICRFNASTSDTMNCGVVNLALVIAYLTSPCESWIYRGAPKFADWTYVPTAEEDIAGYALCLVVFTLSSHFGRLNKSGHFLVHCALALALYTAKILESHYLTLACAALLAGVSNMALLNETIWNDGEDTDWKAYCWAAARTCNHLGFKVLLVFTMDVETPKWSNHWKYLLLPSMSLGMLMHLIAGNMFPPLQLTINKHDVTARLVHGGKMKLVQLEAGEEIIVVPEFVVFFGAFIGWPTYMFWTWVLRGLVSHR